MLLIASTAACTVSSTEGDPAEDSERNLVGEQLIENTAEAEQALTTAQIWFTGGDGANVRSGPGTSYAVKGWLAEGTSVGISCQTTGTSVEGTNIWDYLPGYAGYVTDAYVLTGYDGFIPGMPMCSGGGGGGGSSLGATIVTKARDHLPYNGTAAYCNKFSTYWGTGCVHWCSDYARYVWMQAGAKHSGLSQAAISFYTYGINNGTFKSVNSTPAPGDAVIWAYSTNWAEHVAIVTEVSGSSFKSIHGNFDHDYNGISSVYEVGFQPKSWDAGTGAPILGFVSPVK
jgi:hypothetical protein